ncbi:MAG: HAMP domain-containing sensor histidine kinase [Candidatus Kapaibacterium sp.]
MKRIVQDRVQRLSRLVLGDITSYSLENRLLLSTLVVGLIICLPGVFTTWLFPKTPLPLKIIPLVLTAILFVLYYLVRVKKIIEPLLFPASIIAMVGISMIWLLNGGIDGANIIIAFVVLILSLVIVPDTYKKYVLLIFILFTLAIYLVQLNFPWFIIPMEPGFPRWADSLTTVLYCAVMVYFIIRFLHKQYTIERIKSEEFARQLQETNAQLSIINSSKDKFFSIIAHDLKSPFSGFLGLTKLISDEYESLTKEELQEMAKNLHDSAHNLYKLLENLLEWSLVQRGAVKFNPEECSVAMVVKQVIAVQEIVAQQKNITLFSSCPDHIRVLADVPMLNAIFRNLLSNSIKFTPRGGTIEVGVLSEEAASRFEWYSGDGVQVPVIFVRDNGIGMSKEIQGKLFNIVEKVSRPGTENEPSTGLGLMLCHEFIHKHNGHITVESQEGKGTTFYFTLGRA